MAKYNEEATVVSEEASTALATRAEMGEFLDTPNAAARLFMPRFIKLDKSSGNAVIGKENYQLLKPGSVTECVILKIDQRMFMKGDADNPMAPPIKFTEEQAIAAGEVLYWPPRGVEGPKPTVDPYRDIALLIKSPGEASPAFSLDLAGDEWAPGIYSCARTGYRQNMRDDGGILDTIRYEQKHGTRLFQLLWNIQPVVHTYQNGFTGSYLKISLKKRMTEKDPVFAELLSVMPSFDA